MAVDDLLDLANFALEEAGYSVWILLDRLDVAFAEAPQLEERALRSLFRVYLDLNKYKFVSLKIFLRSDIWDRITSSGFREASHITRDITIEWKKPGLLNLIVNRAVQNEPVQKYFNVKPEEVLETQDRQRSFFYRMCPEQVDVGEKKPSTLNWVLSRTKDGNNITAPREVIHFMNELRSVQARKIEVGDHEANNDKLFERKVFKAALKEVSTVRLKQTLYAELSDLQPFVKKLIKNKAEHTIRTLAETWEIDKDEAKNIANELSYVGFFEKRSSKTEGTTYWIPFLFRDGLELVQGSAF